MLRPASRSILRSAQSSLAPAQTTTTRRFLSTALPHQKSRSWKSSAARWGLATASIYYYNTSEIFAEQPAQHHLDSNHDESSISPFNAGGRSSRERKRTPQSVLASPTSEQDGIPETASSKPEPESTSTFSASTPVELEDEASSEGAFNPTTGEINWDCPCLGGMAHGPCGDEFRAAFSCFVFSEEEPKGMDCINKFQGMQECFRAHPDIYAAELEGDDEELDEGLEGERQGLAKEIKERRENAGAAPAEAVRGKRLLEDDPPIERKPLLQRSQTPPQVSTPSPPPPPSGLEPRPPMSEDHRADARVKGKPLPTKRQPESSPSKGTQPEVFDEDLELMPKAWHDSRSGSTPNKKREK